MAQGDYIGAIDQLQVVFAILIFVREHLRVNELKGAFTLLHDSSRMGVNSSRLLIEAITETVDGLLGVFQML